jgi:hypothetical protein
LPSLHADLFLGRSGASENAAPSFTSLNSMTALHMRPKPP